ncbi:MAG: flavin reductase family protein [Methylohalobius sp.]|nr:flavin reductase family protein [Methylohalobius sp.]
MSSPAELFKLLSCGVYVIGVTDGNQYNAFTAAWVIQVSFQPLLLALSINPQHRSYAMLKAGESFTVNVLGKDQAELARHFASPIADRLAKLPWRPGKTGAPILSQALAYLECRLEENYPAGDHRLILGRAVGGARFQPGEPLLYRDTGDMNGASHLFPEKF